MNSWMDDDQDREYPTTEPESDLGGMALVAVIAIVLIILGVCAVTAVVRCLL